MIRNNYITKRRKILIITSSLKFGGGAERFISLLTKYLISKFTISVVTFQHFKDLYPFKGKYYTFKENLKYFRNFKIFELFRPFKIFKLINSLSPDLIISFMDFANVYSIITKLLFKIKTPLICSVRTNPEIAYKKRNRHIYYLIKFLYKLKSVNKIVSVSHDLQDILEKEFRINRQKLETINNGIELEKIRNLQDGYEIDYKEIFENKKIIKYITIGRLTEEKGHKLLIEAFSKVKSKIENSKLIIIGTGPLKQQIEVQIKDKDLKNDVVLLGLRENPYKYLVKSDIFVLSSKHEGFPNVLLEALACGLPIISTDCKTGPREILNNGNFGFLVKVNDPEDLARKMIFLAKDKVLLNKYSKKSKERAKIFDIKNKFNDWTNLINTTIK